MQKMTGHRRAIFLALLAEPGGYTSAELSENLNISLRSVRPCLRGLVMDGLAEKTNERRRVAVGYKTHVWRARATVEAPKGYKISDNFELDFLTPDDSPQAIKQRRDIIQMLQRQKATLRQVMARFDLDERTATTRMRELLKEYHIIGSDGLWQATDEGVRTYLDDRNRPRLRRCMICGNEFESQHVGHRLCDYHRTKSNYGE